MRSNIVFAVLLLLLGGLGTGLYLRGRTPHISPLPELAPVPSASASTAASAAPSASAAPADDRPKTPDPLTLRVSALGWDLAAPGILVNGGTAPGKQSAFAKKHLRVHLSPRAEMVQVEQALARGGDDAEGAHIAIVPLPQFVASYERLRALDPQIFFVAAWSRGREALLSKEDFLSKVPKKGEVEVAGDPGSSAGMLALFGLELRGLEPARVRFVTEPEAVQAARLVAENRIQGAAEQTQDEVVLTTATVSRLVPFVAIAQRSLIDKHSARLADWAEVWLGAHGRVEADPAKAARTVADEKGAPEPLELLGRLGQSAPATLRENAHATGLAGRGAATMAELFRRTWRLWREAQVLTAPPPETSPVSGEVIASLVRAAPKKAAPNSEPETRVVADAGASAPNDAVDPIAVFRLPGKAPDEQRVVTEAGFLADVFRRAPIRVTVHRLGAADKKATQAAVDRIRERYGLDADKVLVGKARGRGTAPATIEILPVP